MKKPKPIDSTNRALLLLLCILLLARGFASWDAVELNCIMEWKAFTLRYRIGQLQSAVVDEYRLGHITFGEELTLLQLEAEARRSVIAFVRATGFRGDPYLLLECDQDVIHAVSAIKSRGIDKLWNSAARAHLGEVYAPSEHTVQSGILVLASRLNLQP